MEGKTLLKLIILNLIERGENWSYINGVLHYDSLDKDITGLWYWFGDLKIARKGQTTSGDMNNVKRISFENNVIVINKLD